MEKINDKEYGRRVRRDGMGREGGVGIDMKRNVVWIFTTDEYKKVAWIVVKDCFQYKINLYV